MEIPVKALVINVTLLSLRARKELILDNLSMNRQKLKFLNVLILTKIK